MRPVEQGIWSTLKGYRDCGCKRTRVRRHIKIEPWPTACNDSTKPNRNLCSNQPWVARMQSVADHFPNFCPCFQCNNHRKLSICSPTQPHRMLHFSLALPQLLQANSFRPGRTQVFSYAPYSSACFWVTCQNANDGGWLPCCCKLDK